MIAIFSLMMCARIRADVQDTRMTIHEYYLQEYGDDCGYGTSSCTCTGFGRYERQFQKFKFFKKIKKNES